MTGEKQKYRKTKLLIAAVIYMAGITGLAAGSFIHHRNDHLQQLNAGLFGYAAAARELLIDDIHELQHENTSLHTRRQQQLKNIAQQGNLTLLGALRRSDYAVTVISDENFATPDTLKFLIPEAHGTTNEKTKEMTSFNHPELGDLRIAKLMDQKSGTVYFSAYNQHNPASLQPGDILFTAFAMIFLTLLALPLVIVTRKTGQLLTMESEAHNARLRQAVSMQQAREKELREALSDLKRFSSVSTGRESRIIDLKAEVNELLELARMKKRYNIDKTH